MTNDKTTADAMAIAQFRFALIAPVLQELFPDNSRTAYYKRVTEKTLILPDGTAKKYDFKTLEKWVSEYRKGGFDALMPKVRSDKGTSRALSDTAIEEIYRLKESFPRLNATQIHKQLNVVLLHPVRKDQSLPFHTHDTNFPSLHLWNNKYLSRNISHHHDEVHLFL